MQPAALATFLKSITPAPTGPQSQKRRESCQPQVCLGCYPRSPGTHIVGSWVIDSIILYRDPRTGTKYIGTWASRVM